MARQRLSIAQAGLLSRANARIYCGCLGEDRFDREVGPHVTPKLVGGERFYIRSQLDDWIGVDGRSSQPYVSVGDYIDKMMA